MKIREMFNNYFIISGFVDINNSALWKDFILKTMEIWTLIFFGLRIENRVVSRYAWKIHIVQKESRKISNNAYFEVNTKTNSNLWSIEDRSAEVVNLEDLL